MTPRQIELARHALGLRPGCLVSRRNADTLPRDNPDWPHWRSMVEAGLARQVDDPAIPFGMTMFRLTRAGAERALLPGDVLDPEDWP